MVHKKSVWWQSNWMRHSAKRCLFRAFEVWNSRREYGCLAMEGCLGTQQFFRRWRLQKTKTKSHIRTFVWLHLLPSVERERNQTKRKLPGITTSLLARATFQLLARKSKNEKKSGDDNSLFEKLDFILFFHPDRTDRRKHLLTRKHENKKNWDLQLNLLGIWLVEKRGRKWKVCPQIFFSSSQKSVGKLVYSDNLDVSRFSE